jgi:hypothetical protein
VLLMLTQTATTEELESLTSCELSPIGLNSKIPFGGSFFISK